VTEGKTTEQVNESASGVTEFCI